MKRIIYIIVFLSIVFNLFAQDNLQLIDTSKMWSSWRGGSWLPPEYRISSYHKFQDDTLINQKSYKKIWESLDEQQTNWELKGFIRSDTIGNIYARDLLNYEGLIYNFDVQVWDTFTLCNPFNEWLVFQVLVIEIDSTFIIPANQFRKRIKLQGNDIWAGEEYWIEGIGSSAGILQSGADIVQQTGWAMYDALCQWHNDTLVYSNPEYSSCFIIVSTPEVTDEAPEIIIQPNPLVNKSYIIVKGLHFDNFQLEIRNIYGKNVCEYSIQQNKDILLDRRLFKSGLYIITLIDGNNVIARKKLIVQ